MVVSESFYKFLSILLVLSGWGVLGALIGMIVAFLITGCIGILTSIRLLPQQRKESRTGFIQQSALKKMFRYGIPFALTGMIRRGRTRYFNFLTAIYTTNYDIGNYNATHSIANLLTHFTFPLTILFPTFSKIDQKKYPKALQKIFEYSIKYSNFFVLPVVVLVITLSQPLIIFLVGVEFQDSWIYLSLMALGYIRVGLGEPQLRSLLKAQGQTQLIAKLEAVTTTLGLILGLILIPAYGIMGLVLTTLVIRWPAYFIALKKVYLKYKTSPPFNSIRKLWAPLTIEALIMLPLVIMPLNETIKLVIGSILGLGTFLVIAPLTRAINKEDIRLLTNLLGPQPFIGPIVVRILKLLNHLAKDK
jgi:O-antigen/teichoic acid export membrane protein